MAVFFFITPSPGLSEAPRAVAVGSFGSQCRVRQLGERGDGAQVFREDSFVRCKNPGEICEELALLYLLLELHPLRCTAHSEGRLGLNLLRLYSP